MKLFITNKYKFEDEISNSKEIHKKAFNHLLSEVEQGKIPIMMLIDYGKESDVMFRLKSVSEAGIYFFEYDCVIS